MRRLFLILLSFFILQNANSTLPKTWTAHEILKSADLNSDFQYLDTQVIQDYTAVGAVGTALQQYAGRDYTLAELNTYFGAGVVKAYYRWASAATGLLTDETGSYTLTNPNSATLTSAGIMGTAIGTNLAIASSQYYRQATLFETMPTAMTVSVWIKLTNGQTANNQMIFYKAGLTGSYEVYCFISPTGVITFATTNNAPTVTLTAATIIPSGATSWYNLIFTQDVTNGKRIFVNGKIEAQDITQKTLPAGGTAHDMYIGSDYIPSVFFGGTIANMIFMDRVITQADVDFLYAVSIPLPAALQGTDFQTFGKYKNLGIATNIKQFTPNICQIRTTDILLNPDVAWQSTDSRRLVGKK